MLVLTLRPVAALLCCAALPAQPFRATVSLPTCAFANALDVTIGTF